MEESPHTSRERSPSEDEHLGPVGHGALIALLAGTAALATFGWEISEGYVLALYGLLFGPYVLLAWHWYRTDSPSSPWALGVIVAAAVGVRLLLLPADPLLSDDLFRYVWDGRVGLSGINPYIHPPSAEELAHLRDEAIWPNINHPDVPTIYPPGAQYLFQINALLGGGLVGIKSIFVVLEAGCVALCGWWLSTGDRAWSRARLTLAFVLYALNPLVFVETAWSGHLDVGAWSLLTAGLVLVERRCGWRASLGAGALIGASIAVKFLGLLVLPLVLFGTFEDTDVPIAWRHRLLVVTVAPLVTLMAYVPFLGAGSDLFAGFGTYAEKWRGNDGAYRVVYRTSRHLLRKGGTPEDRDADDSKVIFRFTFDDGLVHQLGGEEQREGGVLPAWSASAGQLAATIAKGMAVFVVMIVLSLAVATRLDPILATLAVVLTLYGFAPIVHPWYVAWLIPLAALRPNWSTFVYSATVLAAYLAWVSARTGGEWHVPDWMIALEYGAVALAVVVDIAREEGEVV